MNILEFLEAIKKLDWKNIEFFICDNNGGVLCHAKNYIELRDVVTPLISFKRIDEYVFDIVRIECKRK